MGQKISSHSTVAMVSGDFFEFLDVSDTTESPDGTLKKRSFSNHISDVLNGTTTGNLLTGGSAFSQSTLNYSSGEYIMKTSGDKMLWTDATAGGDSFADGIQFHIRSAGRVGPTGGYPGRVNFVVEDGGGNNAIAIITPNGSFGSVDFGDGGDADAGRVVYGHTSDEFTWYTAAAARMTLSATGLTLASGTAITEFSIDGTMAGNSDDAVPTEKAVVSYVGAIKSGVNISMTPGLAGKVTIDGSTATLAQLNLDSNSGGLIEFTDTNSTGSIGGFQIIGKDQIGTTMVNLYVSGTELIFQNEMTGGDVSLLADGYITLPGLPTSNPGGSGRVWNDSGTLKIT